MYDPIFAKSFSHSDRRRFGCCALLLSFVVALSICSTTFKPRLHPLSTIGDTVNLQLSINSVEDVLTIDEDISDNFEPITVGNDANQPISINAAPNMVVLNETDEISQPVSINASQNMIVINETKSISQPILFNAAPEIPVINEKNTISQPIAITTKEIEPLCKTLKANADYCEMQGDIRLDPNSSTIFLVRPRPTISSSIITSWTVQPYPRKGIAFVKNWTVKLAAEDDNTVPKCSKTHTHPALLFSMGGYSGNHFHDFADILIPLFSTSFHLKREVQFLASDYKPWWPSKFRGLLDRLTRHELVDIDAEREVNCYNEFIAGLKFQSELVIDPLSTHSSSMRRFRQFLREAYSLERTKATKRTKGINDNNQSANRGTKPRLMIVSRKRTRILSNEDEVARLARKLGYEVVVAEADVSTNLTRFAQTVNSCDVLMGIHGAGLTNMVFLPDNAILIQIVPLGGIEVFARLDFGNPASGMNIRYLEYDIDVKESSLFQRYPINDPVLNDPMSFHRKGWGQLRSTYLDNQNVTVDIRRFKPTLAKALKLLQR